MHFLNFKLVLRGFAGNLIVSLTNFLDSYRLSWVCIWISDCRGRNWIIKCTCQESLSVISKVLGFQLFSCGCLVLLTIEHIDYILVFCWTTYLIGFTSTLKAVKTLSGCLSYLACTSCFILLPELFFFSKLLCLSLCTLFSDESMSLFLSKKRINEWFRLCSRRLVKCVALLLYLYKVFASFLSCVHILFDELSVLFVFTQKFKRHLHVLNCVSTICLFIFSGSLGHLANQLILGLLQLFVIISWTSCCPKYNIFLSSCGTCVLLWLFLPSYTYFITLNKVVNTWRRFCFFKSILIETIVLWSSVLRFHLLWVVLNLQSSSYNLFDVKLISMNISAISILVFL